MDKVFTILKKLSIPCVRLHLTRVSLGRLFLAESLDRGLCATATATESFKRGLGGEVGIC